MERAKRFGAHAEYERELSKDSFMKRSAQKVMFIIETMHFKSLLRIFK